MLSVIIVLPDIANGYRDISTTVKLCHQVANGTTLPHVIVSYRYSALSRKIGIYRNLGNSGELNPRYLTHYIIYRTVRSRERQYTVQ